MISRKIDRKVSNDNYRALALYVADAKSKSRPEEKALMSWQAGCMAENYLMGMIEVEATQAMNTRTKKEKTYHLLVSFRPEDEAKLSPKDFEKIELEFARTLGFDEHQRHCGVHKNTDNLHMHIAYNMINPNTFNRHEPYRDYRLRNKLCRELELKYGLKIDLGIDDSKEKSETKTNIKAQTIEAHTGQQSLFNYVAEQRPKIMEALEKATTWEEFHGSILKLGLEAKQRGNGMIFKDRYGKHGAKASDIDRGLSKGNLEKKLGEFIEPPKHMFHTIKAQESYTAVPIHQGTERDNLYEKFKLEMEQRRLALEVVKLEEKEVFNANRAKWAEKRKILNRYPMLPQHKQQVLHDMKMKEQEDLDSSRATLKEKTKAIREDTPYTSWAKCLQHKAGQGDEVALAILRSKNVKIEPEMDMKTDTPYEKYQKKMAEIAQKSNLKQKEILDGHGIAHSHKKALISVTKMNELLEKESIAQKKGVSNGGRNGTRNEEKAPKEAPKGVQTAPEAEQIQYKIDAKGTVIFTLETGGTIRDTGNEIHFSSHDPNAQVLAQKFATLKWGRQVLMAENTFKLEAIHGKTCGFAR